MSTYNAEQSRAYKQSHKEQVRANKKRWNDAHPEYMREYLKRYRAKHRKTAIAYARRYYRENKPAFLADCKRRYEENWHEYRARAKAYALKNVEKTKLWKIAYKARRREWELQNENVRGEIYRFYLHVKNLKRPICHYCRRVIRGKREIDHKMPLGRGGKHCLANLVIACVPCNHRKHSKTVEEFMATRYFRELMAA